MVTYLARSPTLVDQVSPRRPIPARMPGLNRAAAAFSYLRVVVYMFMREPQSEQPALSHGRLLWGGLIVATILTVALGLIPGPLLDIVRDAAGAIG